MKKDAFLGFGQIPGIGLFPLKPWIFEWDLLANI
jgi:hypothetical protein